MLSAAIFVFVGVDFNHFRYVLDFEVTVQGLFGDVPGGTSEYSEHIYWNWTRCASSKRKHLWNVVRQVKAVVSLMDYSDTSANEDNSFRNHIR